MAEAEIGLGKSARPAYSLDDIAIVPTRRTRDADLVDISTIDRKGDVTTRAAIGELVWVQLPSLESLPSWVRWTQKAHSGIEFDRPMHPAVFDMMAGRLAPAND